MFLNKDGCTTIVWIRLTGAAAAPLFPGAPALPCKQTQTYWWSLLISSKLSAVEIYMMWDEAVFPYENVPSQILLTSRENVIYISHFELIFKCWEWLTMNPGAPFFPGDPFSPCKTKAVELFSMCDVCLFITITE